MTRIIGHGWAYGAYAEQPCLGAGGEIGCGELCGVLGRGWIKGYGVITRLDVRVRYQGGWIGRRTCRERSLAPFRRAKKGK